MGLPFVEFRAVRIVCDFILKDHVLKDVLELGASGYTWGRAEGAGEHDFDGHDFTGPERVWVEVWCDVPLMEKIVTHFHQEGFRKLALIIGVQPVFIHQRDAHRLLHKHR
jgi:hypothetical protein